MLIQRGYGDLEAEYWRLIDDVSMRDVNAATRTTPFEIRTGPFVDPDLDDDVIGTTALRRIKIEGAKRHPLGIVIEGCKEDED